MFFLSSIVTEDWAAVTPSGLDLPKAAGDRSGAQNENCMFIAGIDSGG